MNAFKDFGIKTPAKGFVGDKIKINKLFDRAVTVFDFKIGPSKYFQNGNGMCLELQIEFNGDRRVVFTGSVFLMDMIKMVPQSEFPFTTVIKEINDHFEFT